MALIDIDRLLHADWSLSPSKRWYTQARRFNGLWQISAPVCIDNSRAWCESVLMAPSQGATLAGFDFPIGVPGQWARQVNVTDFRQWLETLETPQWQHFFDTAATRDEISLTRPFYPRRAGKGMRQSDLTQALGVESFDALRRQCERDMLGRQPCPLFWTLGANQVGKAAQVGWQDVIRPAVGQGAALWPFDGELASLAVSHRCILCETWPTLAARLMGAELSGRQSKRRQSDRLEVCRRLLGTGLPVAWETPARAWLESGFGERADGEDAFDAMLGLVMMIAVVEGQLPASSALSPMARHIEGWILGWCPDETPTS
ncbi:hypothetical protein C8D96_0344 [Kushneria marisflavi]|uniref:Uncharacterized protein n=1 Tax=Kushneria marisflavi TaxID=157779 RepID=A0A240UK32_9GAMM|nr:hypothetical protein B9H00_01210 [Kushneria marisflavi]RKD86891.1 hypothetical protein C8D96_0344 [Kushneria marisflavi]